MDGFKRAAAFAGAAVATAAIAIGKNAVTAASDLSETVSKTQVIFGKATPAVQKFADTAAASLGQSKQQALDAAATFATFGKSAGLSGQALVGFSTKLTGLASDMASFSNTSPEEAITAIGAALRGESEPIRQYGVLLDEATLKAEAMSLGLIKNVKDQGKIEVAQQRAMIAQRNYTAAVKEHGKNSIEAQRADATRMSAVQSLSKATEGTIPPLTQQQKVLAAQSSILKQTTAAQGDFARTSDGLANKQRIVKAELSNMSAELGAKLLPAVLKAVTAFKSMADFVQRNGSVIGSLAAVLGGLATAVWAVNAAAKAYAATQAALNVVLTANPIGIVIVAIAALVAGIVIAYRKSETFRNIVNTAFEGVKKAGTAMWHALRSAFSFIAEAFLTVAGVIIHGAAKMFGWVPGVGGKLRSAAAAFDSFRAKVEGALSGAEAAGRAWGQGLAAGIAASGAVAVATAEGVARKIAIQTARIHATSSPSKVAIRLGGYWSEGLKVGIEKGGKAAIAAAGTLAENIVAKVQATRDKIASIRDSVAGAVRGVLDIGAIGASVDSGQVDAEGNAIMRTPSARETIGGFAAQAKAFATALAEMARRKLAPSIIAAVAAAGPVSGLTAAQALAQSSKADVAAINSSMKTINQAAGQAANTAVNTTRLPAELKREQETLGTLRRIEDQLKAGNVAEVKIKGDDLYVIVKREEKKAARR